MKIVIDYDICESNGLCVVAAADLLEFGDDDMPKVLKEPADPLAERAARAAANLCPRQAIRLEP